MTSAGDWAEEDFGTAKLGDERRTRRLVAVAAEVAARPAGTVTRACASSASREGAFRLLESRRVHVDAVRAATHAASARRCADQDRVFVAVDASVLSVTDEKKRKELGNIGSRRLSGLHVMSALAVDADGTALGICAQETWVRNQRSPHSGRKRSLPDVPSETRHWIEVLETSHALLEKEAPGCQPWFQLDRGADCWQVFDWASAKGALITVRATHDRRLDSHVGRLWKTVENSRVIATEKVKVASRRPVPRAKRIGNKKVRKTMTPARQARIAAVRIRAKSVTLSLVTLTGERLSRSLNAVLVKEVRAPKDDAIEWMLLTTHPISSRKDVLNVIAGYSMRWRIEDFHRAWKRGLCRVEDTQLRSRSAIEKWATILAAVATRAMNLSKLARTTPDVPATEALSAAEIRALIALREPKGVRLDFVPNLGQAVRWIADLGGYTGPWNGPPGPTVIGRGLHDVMVAARVVERVHKMR